MAIDVAICNLARGHLGYSTIESPSEVTSGASLASSLYNIALKNVLSETGVDWGFARKRSLLTQTTIAIDGYEYVYLKPSDCVQPRYLLIGLNVYDVLSGGVQASSFKEFYISDETVVLATNLANATLEYTAFVGNSSIYPPYFVMAFSYALAILMADPLKRTEKLKDLTALYNNALSKAATANARSSYTSAYTASREKTIFEEVLFYG
jgi:hypothetical protein